MKIVQETTVWNPPSPGCNHTYFLNDSMTQMVAYIRAGTRKKVTFSKPMTFDRRGRTFLTVKNIEEQESIRVEGSKGQVYSLTQSNGQWRCSCPGHSYRGTCKHLDLAPKG
jgi:hypothetical protein